jgi:hypothetical protein
MNLSVGFTNVASGDSEGKTVPSDEAK